MCIGGMAEGQRKPCSVVELVAEFHLTAELHHVPEILAAAFDPEARGEAAGQHHTVEEGDVDQHADAAPDAAVGSNLQPAPRLQVQEVFAVAILQAEVDRVVILMSQVVPAGANADHSRRLVQANLTRSEDHTSEL